MLMTKWTIDLGIAHSQASEYWKLNKSIFDWDNFLNEIKELVYKELTDNVLNIHRWLVLERAIRHKSIRFKKQQNLPKTRMKWSLIKDLEKTLRRGYAYHFFA